MLLLVLMTGFVRQSWNLGVTFLCFWLVFQLLISTFNSIAWSDNNDVKLLIYCDIGNIPPDTGHGVPLTFYP